MLPGVVQIDWAVLLADQYLETGMVAAQNFQVKFTRMVMPEAKLSLTLHCDRKKRMLRFDYRCGADAMSSGRIALEPLP